MKLRNYVELLGLRAGAKRYGYEMRRFDSHKGPVHYAQWQHPRETEKSIEQADIDAYSRYVGEGDFCIDIGAHTGDTTIPMAIAAGRQGLTLALEPNPFVYHVLEKNARANSELCRIETIMAAAAMDCGFIEFEYSDAGYCNGGRHENMSALKHGHAYKLEVFALNLERELEENFSAWLPRLRFIKTDAEGYDLQVLRSMESVLARCRPVIKAEVFKHVDTATRLALVNFLSDLGYCVTRIDEQPVGKGPVLGESNIDEKRHYDLLATA